MTDPLTEMLASLKEKLRAATPGPYRNWCAGDIVAPDGESIFEGALSQVNDNAEYLSALDPDLVAAFIGCAEALAAILAKHPDKCEHIHAGWGALARLRKLAEGRRG